MSKTTNVHGSKRREGGIARWVRRSIAAIAAIGIGLSGAVLGATAAQAAPGDYTISITSPATVLVNEQFSQVITVSCPKGCTGITIEQALPSELQYIGADTSGILQSVSGMPSTSDFGATLTYTLNDISTAGVYTFNVTLRNNVDWATTTVSPSSSWNLEITSDGQTESSTTVPTGDVVPFANKLEETVPGSGNRTVLYTLRGRVNSNSTAYPSDPAIGRFQSEGLTWSDTIPAGAQVMASTPAGEWTSVVNADFSETWTYTQPGKTTLTTWHEPTLTVYYPPTATLPDATEVTFPNGTQPPLNVVQVRASDLDGTVYGPASSSVQGPEFSGGSGPGIWLGLEKENTSTGAHQLSLYNNSYRMRGVVHDTTTEQVGARNFVLVDDATSDFWTHANVNSLMVSFNARMRAAAAPWELQFTYGGAGAPSGWVTERSGPSTDIAAFTVNPRVTGSTDVTGPTLITRPEGQYVTGWRLLVSPGAADPVLENQSMATVSMNYYPIWRSLVDGTPLGGPTDPVPLTNTARLTGDRADTGAALTPVEHSHTRNIRDGVSTRVTVSIPSTLNVGASGQKATTSIEVADDREVDACVATVLPQGVRWSGAPLTLVSSTLPVGATGTPLAIASTTPSSTSDNRDVVTVCFDRDFPPSRDGDRPSGPAPKVEFDIPIEVLPSAYHPPASNSVTTYAYAIVNDPASVATSVLGAWTYNDQFDLDPTRTSVSGASRLSTIQSQGGLQLQKEVSVDGGTTWGLLRETDQGATADWRVTVMNNLPSNASDVAVCDALPLVGDGRGSDFALTLVGPVAGAPVGSMVEYATVGGDGCDDAAATWGPTAAGANAFRVQVPVLDAGDDFELEFETTLPATGLVYTDTATNHAVAAATVSGVTYDNLTSNQATVGIRSAPDITIVKGVQGGATTFEPGTEVTYTFTVQNTGNVPLTDIVVTDDATEFTGNNPAGMSAVDCDGVTSLAVGAAPLVCTATYTPTWDDALQGSIYNEASVAAEDPAGDDVSDGPSDVEITWTADPAISIVKSAELQGDWKVGANVRYSFVVTNEGNTPLTDVKVNEQDFSGTGSMTAVDCPSDALAFGAQMVCTATYKLTKADAEAGEVTNIATASGEAPNGDPVESDPSDAIVSGSLDPALVPGISMVKSSDKKKVSQAGEKIVYTFTITNTGETVLANVGVTEGEFTGAGKLGDVICPTAAERMVPGQVVKCTVAYTVTSRDLDGKRILNTAVTHGDGGEDTLVTSADSTAAVSAADLRAGMPVTGGASLGIAALVAGLLLATGALLVLRRKRREA